TAASLASATRDRGQEADLVLGIDAGVEAAQVADILTVEVDVDEAMERAVRRSKAIAERRVSIDQRVDDVADGLALDVDGLDAAHVGTQDLGNEDAAHRGPSGVVRANALSVDAVDALDAAAAAAVAARIGASPRARASRAESEQTGQAGSRSSLS